MQPLRFGAPSHSRYRGVYAYRAGWRAALTVQGGREYGPVRDTEQEAARDFNALLSRYGYDPRQLGNRL